MWVYYLKREDKEFTFCLGGGDFYFVYGGRIIKHGGEFGFFVCKCYLFDGI